MQSHVFSVQQVRELDRRTILEAGIPGRLLMEVAGFGAWWFAHERGLARPGAKRVLVMAGKGNNAGDAFVVARFFAASGVQVRVLGIEDPNSWPEGDAKANGLILGAFDVGFELATVGGFEAALSHADLIVDGLLGTGLQGEVRAPYRELIESMNRQMTAPVLALDLPSGLCGDRGVPLGCAIKARWTVTHGAIKAGLLRGEGPTLAGEIALVPLPYPPAILASVQNARDQTDPMHREAPGAGA